jgi:hypothetical protein
LRSISRPLFAEIKNRRVLLSAVTELISRKEIRIKTSNFHTINIDFCLGIIYTRADFDDDLADTEIFQVSELEEDNSDPIGEREVTKVENLKSITSVIKDFDFFAAPKWKIASDGRGSGNTANIGSIKDIEALKSGKGVFSELGEEWFDEYWINYGSASMVKDSKPIKITNIWDFLEFKGRTDLFDKVGIGAKQRKNK